MFSKNDNNFLVGFTFFLTGSVVSYIACQYEYLSIKKELEVVDLLLSLGTIGIGLYIAIVLERNRNKSQNFYSYVEGKYDSLWETFIQFSSVLEASPRVELEETAKWFHTIDQKINPLIKLIEAFEYNTDLLHEIEGRIDELEVFISGNPNIQDNVLELETIRQEVVSKLNDINELFGKYFKEISNV